MKFSRELLRWWMGGEWLHAADGGGAESFNGFCIDSRRLTAGQCFLALRTERDDGHRYLAEVASKDGWGAVVERYEPSISLPQLRVPGVMEALSTLAEKVRSTWTMPVVALAGSFGKTSTKDLIALLLGEECSGKTVGNFNNCLGLPLSITRIDENARYVVLELGVSKKGDMEPLLKLTRPTVGVVLNVSSAHLEGFGALEATACEKCLLLDNVLENGPRFMFADLLSFEPFRRRSSETYVLYDVAEETPDVPLKIGCAFEREGSSLWRLTLFDGYNPQSFIIPFALTRSFLNNFAAALAVALKLGIDPFVLQERLCTWRPSAHRGEWLSVGNKRVFVDCYNANPTTVVEGIRTFQMQAPADRDHLYVLGTMAGLGNQSEALHFELGSNLCVRPHDRIILVGNDAQALHEGLLRHHDPSQITRCAGTEDARAAIELFEGIIFLKGSRYHQLEYSLPGIVS